MNWKLAAQRLLRAGRARRARIVVLEDRSVRVLGVLTGAEREQLELTHFDTGRLVDGGWLLWWPREVSDA